MGKLIVIDGLDGSGKTTQSERLYEKLAAQGRNVKLIHFPDYDSEAATLVKMYLRGEFGHSPDDTGAYAAATFYAAERYASYKMNWESFYREEDAIVLTCRYTTANAVHQLPKIEREHWDDFLSWLYDFEYQKLGIPAPDKVFYLEMDPAVSEKLLQKRNQTTGQALDIHEKDKAYEARCYKAALYSSEKLGWDRVSCCRDGALLSVEEMGDILLSKTVEFLDSPRA